MTLRAILVATLLVVASSDEHIVLKPPSIGISSRMVVFIPGGLVPNSNYVATARAIQEAAVESGLSIWFVIPAVFRRLCLISCSTTSLCYPLHSAVEDALNMAEQQGWQRGNDTKETFLAGHSLGGVCANTLFQAYSSPKAALPYAGLMIFGSYVDATGEYDIEHYPVPVFTLNGELDAGSARPGKTAIWWRQHLKLQKAIGDNAALQRKPVVIAPKMNHSDFCPGFDVAGDLPAEISQTEATYFIGNSAAAFLILQDETIGEPHKSQAMSLLRKLRDWTSLLLTPYLKAQDMEVDRTKVMVSTEGASSFCEEAQHVVAALSDSDNARIKVEDGFHSSATNLEHCHPNWTVQDDGHLLINSCSHTEYYSNIGNIGGITAASEVACKLLSYDRVAQLLNTTPASEQVPCSKGNMYAVSIAEAMAPAHTLERFRKRGRGWCFLPDFKPTGNIGPIWVFTEHLQLKENATCMSVSSPDLFSDIHSSIYPGNQYCKFLSPARVLDWMMSDSLKPGSGVQEAGLEGLRIIV